MEQEFKMRRIEDALNNPDTTKEDMITVFLACNVNALYWATI